MDEKQHSGWAIVCFVGSIFCVFLAWVAGTMIVDWHAERGNGGGVISLSIISGFGLLGVCGSLMLVGLTLAIVGMFLGVRWANGISIILHIWLALHLVHGPERANERYKNNFARSFPPPAPRPLPRIPSPAEYLRPHESLRGFAVARHHVVTMGFSPPTSPAERGDSIRVWSLNDGSLTASFPRHLNSTLTLLKDGRGYEEIEDQLFLHRFDVDERTGPFQRPAGHNRVLGVFENRIVVRIASDERRIELWNLDSGKEAVSFTNREPFACHALSSDSRKLAFVSRSEGVLRVVDCLTRAIQAIPFEKFGVMGMRFSENGQSVVLVGEAPQDAPKPRERGAVHVSHAVSSGSKYFPAGTQVTVFDLRQPTNISFVLPDLKFSSGPLFVSSDRERLILGSPESFSIIDLRTSPAAALEKRGHVRVCVSADGRFIATYNSYPHGVRFWNGETGETLAEELLQPITGPVAHHIEFAPDNRTVVVLRGGMVELCNVDTNRKSFLLVDSVYTNTVTLRASR